MSGSLKYKTLVPNVTYICMFKTRHVKGVGCVPIYRRVTLVEKQSNNKVLIQWTESMHDKPIWQKDRRILGKTRIQIVSAANLLATAKQWDNCGHHFDIKRRHCMPNDAPVGIDSLAGQGSMGQGHATLPSKGRVPTEQTTPSRWDVI